VSFRGSDMADVSAIRNSIIDERIVVALVDAMVSGE
jgi:hypothetical protein